MSSPQRQTSQGGNGFWTGKFKVISGTVDPTVGDGVKGDKGTIYLRATPGSGLPQVWQKTTNTLDTDWQLVGGSTPAVLYPSDAPFEMPLVPVTIPFTGSALLSLIYLSAQGGAAIDARAVNPQIALGNIDGQILKIIGVTPAPGGVLLGDGNGLDQNGDIQVDDNQAIEYVWDAAGNQWWQQGKRS